MTTCNNYNPVIEAVKSGSCARLRNSLRKGVDVKLAAADGMTALMLAAEQGSFDMLRLLLEHGVDVNQTAALL